MLCDYKHEAKNYDRAFFVGIILNLSYVVFELITGELANSFALIADAVHNASDVLSLILAWLGAWLARLPPSERYTYGTQSASILIALLNGLILQLAMGGIAWEALQSFKHPEVVTGIVIIVALIGVLVNTITALMFFSDSQKDLNIRGAFLHMAADAGLSFAVAIAGIDIAVTGWFWYDSLMTLMMVFLITHGLSGLLKKSLTMALHAVPDEIDPFIVYAYLSHLPDVARVRDIHIWSVSTTSTVLSARLLMPKGHPGDAFLAEIERDLHNQFGIEYTTIQIEVGLIQNSLKEGWIRNAIAGKTKGFNSY
jgi:cobalt-zinc-cadmium efflux system protein